MLNTDMNVVGGDTYKYHSIGGKKRKSKKSVKKNTKKNMNRKTRKNCVFCKQKKCKGFFCFLN